MNLFDPLHGFIQLTPIEESFIANPLFQRLRNIHQMGVAYLVYPGATNKRFEHSLGTMQFASRIYRQLVMERNRKHLPKAIFPEIFDTEKRRYWQQIVRLAALCHDLGHVPFSHLLEEIFIPNGSHEDFSYQCILSKELNSIWSELSCSPKEVQQQVAKIALGESYFLDRGLKLSFTPWERVLGEIITGDNFGADRMDYLLRDSKATGLSYGIFDHEQVIKLLKIVPFPRKKRHKGSDEWTLGIHIDGMQAVESLLMSRYFMFSRVYHNPKVYLFAWCFQEFVKKAFAANLPLKGLKNFLYFTDVEILYKFHQALKSSKHSCHTLAKKITERKLPYKYLRVKNTQTSLMKLQKAQKDFGSKCRIFMPKNTVPTPAVIYGKESEVFFASSYSSIYTQIPHSPSEIVFFYSRAIEKEVKKQLSGML